MHPACLQRSLDQSLQRLRVDTVGDSKSPSLHSICPLRHACMPHLPLLHPMTQLARLMLADHVLFKVFAQKEISCTCIGCHTQL